MTETTPVFPCLAVYGLLEVMQPNDPYQAPQVPSDYLNQIAPPERVKTLNPIVLWGLIGGALLLAIAIIIGISSLSKGPSASSLTAVAARLNNLAVISDDAEEYIQSSQLRTLNSNLNISLVNTNRDLATTLKSQKINIKDKKNATVAAAANELETVQGRLEDARLNAVYDRTYAREMLYLLRTVNSDMERLYKASKSAGLKETLNTANDNFIPVIDGLNNFNES